MNTVKIRPNRDEKDTLYAAHNKALIDLARENDKLVVCYADFPPGQAGEVFRSEYPDRIIDVGIAEAHLITSAAGLADSGFVPFTHCHGLFALGRGFNQIRQNVAYDNRNVKIVFCNSGALWGDIGPSHVSVEDISALRAVPNLVILSPSDPVSAEKAVIAAAGHLGPVIIRLTHVATPHPKIYGDDLDFQIGSAYLLKDGSDVAILSTGVLLSEALKAAELLGKEGVSASVIDVPTLKPMDEGAIVEAARKTGALVTVEDGSVIGGLGGAVAEIVTEKHPAPVLRVGMKDLFGESGKPDEIKEYYGLKAGNIVEAAKKALAVKRA